MDIPRVGNNRFVVIRAEYTTGIILNNDNTYYVDSGEDYYRVLNSLELAREFARKEIISGKVEIIIYNDQSELVEVHYPN